MCGLHRAAQPSLFGVTMPRKPCVVAPMPFMAAIGAIGNEAGKRSRISN
jgi:hypothetical protein